MSRAFVSGPATKVVIHLFPLGEGEKYCGRESGCRMTECFLSAIEGAKYSVWCLALVILKSVPPSQRFTDC